MFCTATAISYARSEVVDFSYFVRLEGIALIAPFPIESEKVTVMFRTFSWQVTQITFPSKFPVGNIRFQLVSLPHPPPPAFLPSHVATFRFG